MFFCKSIWRATVDFLETVSRFSRRNSIIKIIFDIVRKATLAIFICLTLFVNDLICYIFDFILEIVLKVYFWWLILKMTLYRIVCIPLNVSFLNRNRQLCRSHQGLQRINKLLFILTNFKCDERSFLRLFYEVNVIMKEEQRRRVRFPWSNDSLNLAYQNAHCCYIWFWSKDVSSF
jgi:hypothetical protein